MSNLNAGFLQHTDASDHPLIHTMHTAQPVVGIITGSIERDIQSDRCMFPEPSDSFFINQRSICVDGDLKTHLM